LTQEPSNHVRRHHHHHHQLAISNCKGKTDWSNGVLENWQAAIIMLSSKSMELHV